MIEISLKKKQRLAMLEIKRSVGEATMDFDFHPFGRQPVVLVFLEQFETRNYWLDSEEEFWMIWSYLRRWLDGDRTPTAEEAKLYNRLPR